MTPSRRPRSLAVSLILAAVLLAGGVFGWRWFERDSRRRRDVAAAQAVLDRFPPPASARPAGRHVETLRSEGGKVFGHNLRLSYRLPATARPSEVFGHYDAIVPPGWHLADGADCMAMMIPPPPPAPGRPPVSIGPLVVSAPRTQRFYTDGHETVRVRVWRDRGDASVQFEVSNTRGMQDCTEAPDGGPDPEAAAFQ